jgi:hypothetical protein
MPTDILTFNAYCLVFLHNLYLLKNSNSLLVMRTSDALPRKMRILSGVRSDKNLFAVCTNARRGLEAIIPDTTAQAIAEYILKTFR